MSERDVLTADFFPEKNLFPTFTPEDYLKQTAEDMQNLLEAPAPSSSPVPTLVAFGPPILNAYAKIASILRRATPPAPSPPAPTPRVPELTLPVAPPRVPEITLPVAPPRVPNITLPVAPPRVPPALLAKKIPPPKLRPATRNYRDIGPRFGPRRSSRLHFAQSIQHDPTIAGKMFNPITGRPENIDTLLCGPDSPLWTTSLANEWARCAQGLSANRSAEQRVAGTDTIFFIRPRQVPAGRKVTYANFVCTMRPGKAELYRIHMTVGGDRLDAYQYVRSPAVGITDTKLHINSTISDAKDGARYCTGDLKDFFL
jgi:hypothetical protein